MPNNPNAVANLKPCKPWETANPNGRPRKGISLINKQLADKWYDPATKQDIEANYMSLLQLGKSELENMLWDDANPMLIRILCENMLSWKWFDVIEKMLDRGIGKAVQRNEDRIVNKDGDDLLDLSHIQKGFNEQEGEGKTKD